MAVDDSFLFDPESEPSRGSDRAGWEVDASDVPEGPDDLDRIVEVADMMTVFAAERVVRVDRMRRGALADATRHGRVLSEVIDRSFRLELAAGLRITEHAAGELIALSEALVHRYPAALASLSRARMTERHAAILVTAVDALEPDLRDGVLGRAVELAESEPVGVFRRSLRRLIDAVRYVTLATRHEAALEARRVVIEHAEDGMAWVHAFIPAVDAHAIFGRATAIAKVLGACEDETRTLDQLRADVFGDLLIDGDTTTHPDTARGIRATVAVTVPALSILAPHPDAAGSGIAVIEGVGPIPMDVARDLCGGADGWMRILTHPETGMVLSVGRDQYRPPPSLRKLVRWRADRCMAPGCGIPASRCEIDHSVAWEHGGHTTLGNLCPLCKGHHTVKHHGGWLVRQLEGSGGALQWTSPTGRIYLVHPERRVPTFTPAPDGNPPF